MMVTSLAWIVYTCGKGRLPLCILSLLLHPPDTAVVINLSDSSTSLVMSKSCTYLLFLLAFDWIYMHNCVLLIIMPLMMRHNR